MDRKGFLSGSIDRNSITNASNGSARKGVEGISNRLMPLSLPLVSSLYSFSTISDLIASSGADASSSSGNSLCL